MRVLMDDEECGLDGGKLTTTGWITVVRRLDGIYGCAKQDWRCRRAQRVEAAQARKRVVSWMEGNGQARQNSGQKAKSRPHSSCSPDTRHCAVVANALRVWLLSLDL